MLKELVRARKCRKGNPYATTAQGAFWLPCGEIQIRSFGGTGDGNSEPLRNNYLQLRNFRDGQVKAAVKFQSIHKDIGTQNAYYNVDIDCCSTVEDVIIKLKGVSYKGMSAYSDQFKGNLTNALKALGMIESLPGPDEVPSPVAVPAKK